MGHNPVKNIQIFQRKRPKIQMKNLEKNKRLFLVKKIIFKEKKKYETLKYSKSLPFTVYSRAHPVSDLGLVATAPMDLSLWRVSW